MNAFGFLMLDCLQSLQYSKLKSSWAILSSVEQVPYTFWTSTCRFLINWFLVKKRVCGTNSIYKLYDEVFVVLGSPVPLQIGQNSQGVLFKGQRDLDTWQKIFSNYDFIHDYILINWLTISGCFFGTDETKQSNTPLNLVTYFILAFVWKNIYWYVWLSYRGNVIEWGWYFRQRH